MTVMVILNNLLNNTSIFRNNYDYIWRFISVLTPTTPIFAIILWSNTTTFPTIFATKYYLYLTISTALPHPFYLTPSSRSGIWFEHDESNTIRHGSPYPNNNRTTITNDTSTKQLLPDQDIKQQHHSHKQHINPRDYLLPTTTT